MMNRAPDSAFLSTAAFVVLCASFALGCTTSHDVRITYQSRAMYPNLPKGTVIRVKALELDHEQIRVGDIIAFEWPEATSKSDELFISRVVATAGDTIAIRNNQLYRNGQPVDEPYAVWSDPEFPTTPPTTAAPDVVVPTGSVFLLGDNRSNSRDSRSYGPLPLTRVRGRVHADRQGHAA